MERSFFYGTDAEIASGSANFSTKITATPTVFGLVAAQAVLYAAVNSTYQSAFTAAITPATRTKGTISSKNDAKKAVRTMASDFAKIIDGTPTVTNQQKIDLGLSVRMTPAPIPRPGVRPGMDVVSVNGRTVSAHIHDSASSNKRGKPAGTTAAWVYSFVGTEYPSDPIAWNFEGATTKAKFDIVFPSTLPGGTQVWVCAAWINGKQQAGPVSVPISSYLQGGGASAETMKVAA